MNWGGMHPQKMFKIRPLEKHAVSCTLEQGLKINFNLFCFMCMVIKLTILRTKDHPQHEVILVILILGVSGYGPY